jgi:hypothetical protein
MQHEAARIAEIEHQKKIQKNLQRAIHFGCESQKKSQFEAKLASATHPHILREIEWKEKEMERCKKCQEIKTHRGEKNSNVVRAGRK